MSLWTVLFFKSFEKVSYRKVYIPCNKEGQEILSLEDKALPKYETF